MELDRWNDEDSVLDNSANHLKNEEFRAFMDDSKIWCLINDVRVFKSQGLAGKSSYECKFRSDACIRTFYDVLNSVKAYKKWFYPISDISGVHDKNIEEIEGSGKIIEWKAKIDVLNAFIHEYTPYVHSLSSLITNKITAGIELKVKIDDLDLNNPENTKMSFNVNITGSSMKTKISTKLIEEFKIFLNFETFENAELTYITMNAQVGSDKSKVISSFINDHLIKSITNLKSYALEMQFSSVKFSKVKIISPIITEEKRFSEPISVENKAKKSLKTSNKASKSKEIVLNGKTDHLKTRKIEETEIIFEEVESSQPSQTFNNAADVGRDPINSKLTKSGNGFIKRQTHKDDDSEEEKIVTSKQELAASESVKKQVWMTKWTLERCTEEQLKVFEDTKYRITKYFEKENPEALIRDINDNLILRFLAHRSFNEPDLAYSRILEYVQYIEKYDFHNLTKEGIIAQAKGDAKKIFEWGLHNFAGFDRLGRPVVVMKIANVDKKIMNDIHINRLYFLYQMKIARARFPPNVDQLINIIDFKDAGLSNLAFSMFKELNPELSKVFPQSTVKNILVHPNWILTMGWKLAKNILSENQQKKVHFIEDANLPHALEEEIDIQNIPKEYGGEYELKIAL